MYPCFMSLFSVLQNLLKLEVEILGDDDEHSVVHSSQLVIVGFSPVAHIWVDQIQPFSY